MKTWMKRVAGLVLVFAMVLTMIPAISAKADTLSKDVTLYVGDVYTITNWSYKEVSVKSSNSKAVKVNVNKKDKSAFDIEVKKASKKPVTVTVSYPSTFLYAALTVNYKITAKKPNLSTKITKMNDSNYLLTIKNTTKTNFDKINVTYKLADAKGGIAKENDVTIYKVPAGKTVYETIYCSSYEATVDVPKSSAKVNWTDQEWYNFNSKVVDASKKLTVKSSEETTTSDYGSKETKVTVKYKNNCSQEVEGVIYIIAYDKDNNIIDVDDYSIYSLNSKASDTKTTTFYHNTLDNRYDHHKVQYFVYYKEKTN